MKPIGGLGMVFQETSRLAMLVFLAAFITGCAVYRPMERATPDIALEPEFSQAGVLPVPQAWWEVFEDEQLNQLMAVALEENRTVRAAWARMEQFAQVSRISKSGLYPVVDATLSAERQRSDEPIVTPMGVGGTTVDARYAGLSVAYQVDLWRKLSFGRRADVLNFEASRQDVEATLLAITASVAELYFSLSAQREMLALLEAQKKVSQEYVDLVEMRFSNGLVTAMDVYFQRLQLAATERQIPQVTQTIKTLSHQLAVLLGKAPHQGLNLTTGTLAQVPGLPETGIPADTLRLRPDVRAAELRLMASDQRVGVAIADRFPSLGISVTGSGQAEAFADVLDGWILSLGANILAPLFDAGRRKAEVARSKAVVQEGLANWEAALLSACAEVEDSLVREQGILMRQEILGRQLALAEAALERSRSNYVHGLTDYLNVLTSLQTLYGLQLEEIGFRLELLTNRIGLYAALGGGTAAADSANDEG